MSTPLSVPRLSVLIPVYNRKEELARCLEALCKQTLSPECYEVLVCDDGSDDHPESLGSYFQQRLQLHFLKEPHKNRASALNNGIRHAQGKTIVFTDSDMMATPHMLEEHDRFHQQHPGDSWAMVGFMDWHPELTITPFMRRLTSERGWQFAYHVLEDGSIVEGGFFYGGNSSVKKQFLLQHGMLDDELAKIEDVELGGRLSQAGLIIQYNASAISYHLHAVTPRSFACRNIAVGQALIRVAQKHPLKEGHTLFFGTRFSVEADRRNYDLDRLLSAYESMEHRDPEQKGPHPWSTWTEEILSISLGLGVRKGLWDAYNDTVVPCSIVVLKGNSNKISQETSSAVLAELKQQNYEVFLQDSVSGVAELKPHGIQSVGHPGDSLSNFSCFAAARATGKYLCFVSEETLCHLKRLPGMLRQAEGQQEIGLLLDSIEGTDPNGVRVALFPRPVYFECGGFHPHARNFSSGVLSLLSAIRSLGRKVSYYFDDADSFSSFSRGVTQLWGGYIQDCDARAALVRLALHKGLIPEAERHLDTLLSEDPNFGEGWLLRGVLGIQKQDFDNAIAAFKNAIVKNGDVRKATLGVGMAQTGQGNAIQAWNTFSGLFPNHPDDEEVIHWLIRAGTILEKWEDLATYLTKFLERNPSNCDIRFALVSIYLRLQQNQSAKTQYDYLRHLNPTYSGLQDLEQAFSRTMPSVA